jgi:hypothetical protein
VVLLDLRGVALYQREKLNPGAMSDQMTNTISRSQLSSEEITYDQKRQMLPEEHISWISDCKRQLAWLQHRLIRDKSILTPDIYSPALTEREMLVAKIDCAECDPERKVILLSDLEHSWNALKGLDKQLDWVVGKKEAEICWHIWEWLEKHQPEQVRRRQKPESHHDLLTSFDTFTWLAIERTHCIATTRRLWRQIVRRKEAKGKKQYNFILSDKAIKRLDRFSKNHELSRARVLEILLQMEDEKDLYLKEQIRVLRDHECPDSEEATIQV